METAVLAVSFSRMRTRLVGLLRSSCTRRVSKGTVSYLLQRTTYHGGFLNAAVHTDPSDIVGIGNLADGDITPFPAGKLGVGVLVGGRRVIEEVLNGGLGQGGVSLARRGRDIAEALDEALAMRRLVGGAGSRVASLGGQGWGNVLGAGGGAGRGAGEAVGAGLAGVTEVFA